MLKKLMPVVLALGGLGGGVGVGLALRPEPEEHAENSEPMADEGEHATEAETSDTAAHAETESGEPAHGSEDAAHALEYVKMSNQFVIPIVHDGRVVSMVVMSLSLEAKAGSTEAIYAKEPKLRDSFLQLLFDHANSGGFQGAFTDGANLIVLRRSLVEAAKEIMPDQITDVLISDLARQDS